MPWWAVAVAVVVLALVVVDIRLDGPLDHVDHRLAARTGSWDLRNRPAARWPLTVGVWFGQRAVVLVGGALIAIGLTWRSRTCEPLLRFVVAVLGVAAVVYGFKFAMARNAPSQDALGVPVGQGASFPSGHLANAILMWGLADWSVRTWATPWWLRRAVRAGRWIAPFAVFTAMMLLNYHWLSDFVGGAAVGVILLGVALWPRWAQVAGWLDAHRPATTTSRPGSRAS